MKTYLSILFLASSLVLNAQVAINTTGSSPDSSAMLDIASTLKGVLVPRMTLTERNAIIQPTNGLLVYQTDFVSGFYYNAGNQATPVWKYITGNPGSPGMISDNDGDTFITTDEAPTNPDNDVINFVVNGMNTMSLVANRLVVSGNYENLFIGDSCGANNTTGSSNVFIGHRAGAQADLGVNNVFVGTEAGKQTHHHYNTFVGAFSGRNNDGGYNNAFFGYESGYRNTCGTFNTFLGFVAGHENTEGGRSVFIGDSAGYFHQVSYNNVFIGSCAGKYNVHGGHNVFIGNQAGKNETGSYKLYISNTDTSRPLIFGKFNERLIRLHVYRLELVNDERNVIIGQNSNPATSGIRNVFVGSNTGQGNLGGSENIFIGDSTGASNTFGSWNTFVGTKSGSMNADGRENLFAGAYSGMNNIFGWGNVFLGNNAGFLNTGGTFNVFTGDSAGYTNTTGQENTFTGALSGKMNTYGSLNIFSGFRSGENNATGSRNTFVGAYAGNQNTTGWRNVYVGLSAGYANTTGNYNTFVGRAAGYNNAAGSGNVFIGSLAGFYETGSYKLYIANNDTLPPLVYGEFDNRLLRFHVKRLEIVNDGNNVILGYEAGLLNTGGSDNVFIGNRAGYNETGSDRLYIANSSTTSPLVYGEFDNQKLRINGQLEITDHDVYVTNASSGIILTSPDGQCWRVTVGNDGSLSTVAISCP